MTETTSYPTWPSMRPLPADGIAGLYADRALERGADPRVLVSLSRSMRSDEARLPVMASAFEEGLTVYDVPKVKQRRVHSSRRLLVAAAVAAVILPLSAMVAGAAAVRDDASGSGYGFAAEIELPELDAAATGLSTASFGLPFGSGSSNGTVTVNGREHRNQVDAEVYTSEESTIVIDGEVVESAERAPMRMPGVFPVIPGL